jgi:putative transposase
MEHNMWIEITRPKYERAGRRYASDLTDAEWRLIERKRGLTPTLH